MDYLIGEFSEATGLSVHTLRYYESLGLLEPGRDSQNRRIYSDSDLSWIEFIKRLKDTDMPLSVIVEYSRLRRLGDSTLEKRLKILEDHKVRLQSKIEAEQSHLKKLGEKIEFYENEIKSKR